MKLINIVGGLGIILGLLLSAFPGIAPCDVGYGQCGDSWVPLLGLALLIGGIVAIVKGRKK